MQQNFILLTRLISEEINQDFSIEAKEKEVKRRVREHCPEVEWISNYATMGPWDYVDVFRAPDTETAMKVGALVRAYGGAQTEIWPAVEWEEYKQIIHGLPGEKRQSFSA
jgi:uncharacterized protein with GYD domain